MNQLKMALHNNKAKTGIETVIFNKLPTNYVVQSIVPGGEIPSKGFSQHLSAQNSKNVVLHIHLTREVLDDWS